MLLCKGGSSFVLQFDGSALSLRQVARFDSNTPHEDPHILLNLSRCSHRYADQEPLTSRTRRALADVTL